MIRDIWRTYLVLIIAVIVMAASCDKETEIVIKDNNPYHQVAFYNVENFFDTLDSPATADEEFTPAAEKNWNTSKLFDKIRKIERVITELDSTVLPAVVGFCEVENRDVLELLVKTTSLKDAGYQIVHKESPDYRGIDVALLYKDDVFELIDYKLWQVIFPFDTEYSTREVLYVKGNLDKLGDLHVLVNHWPSRSGGEIESRPRRIFVAEMVKSKVDSIFSTDRNARIIITGDFNDEPDDLSIVSGLSAYTSFDDPKPQSLFALSKYLQNNSEIGSYKYQGNWNMLDQFVISSALLDTAAIMYCRPQDLGIMNQPYLFEEDDRFMGKKPYRTYLGNYYNGGYSDHLPVNLKIRYKE